MLACAARSVATDLERDTSAAAALLRGGDVAAGLHSIAVIAAFVIARGGAARIATGREFLLAAETSICAQAGGATSPIAVDATLATGSIPHALSIARAIVAALQRFIDADILTAVPAITTFSFATAIDMDAGTPATLLRERDVAARLRACAIIATLVKAPGGTARFATGREVTQTADIVVVA